MNQFFRARWLGGAIVVALMSAAGSGFPVAARACGTVRLGETTVATVQNAPFITLFANGAAVTLLLDTGAQTTVLAPDAAHRIGARRPRIELPREMQGIAGSLRTSEVELQSFTIAGVSIPWRRVRVAPLYLESAFSVKLDGMLGADTLSGFDIDVDLPGHRLALYQKQACAGAAPAWTGRYGRRAALARTDGHPAIAWPKSASMVHCRVHRYRCAI
jgi:hypothetical protein